MLNFPSSFDWQFYRRQDEGLETEYEAYRHFLKVGRPFGLAGSPGCDQGYLFRLIARMGAKAILEIGPGSRPKVVGENVYYFDVKTREELLRRYASEGEKQAVPPVIHYVHEHGDLSIIDRKFDVIISSHMIEHASDLVDHLKQVANIIEPDGIYLIVAPNKHYTFDYFKPMTCIEDVIVVNRKPDALESHFFKCFLLEECRRTHNDAIRHWAGDHGEPKKIVDTIEKVIEKYENVRGRPVAMSGYHRWFFDDESFFTLINSLHRIGLSPLKVQASYNTLRGRLSFNAILSL